MDPQACSLCLRVVMSAVSIRVLARVLALTCIYYSRPKSLVFLRPPPSPSSALRRPSVAMLGAKTPLTFSPLQ